MLESIGNLRNIAYGYTPNIRRQVNMACDEIDGEIAERYMELPVDADGVPIRVGDHLRFCDFKIQCAAVSPERIYYWDEYSNGHWVKSSECRHVKPRTIEDVLSDCCNEWNEHCGEDWESGVYAKYAEEIRGMMA